ncbi:SSrecog-domain-containing protein [Myriangium duriaei CBS 260.36]|uniref:FACT complex subunit POB3 n=1 Tax=Myriangium duriaei CBS 260.36 TaxID=1168546 RepID=A0A9P4JBC7_9PEZI|nr:SSrecog-domain-containing protein [Myriangium duriaei CBS 260.36]
METFENIFLDLSKQSGRCRFAESGLGWKPAGGGDTFTLDKAEIVSAQWSRAAKGQEVKIVSRNHGVIQLDGFVLDDFDRISKALKIWFGVTLEQKEHALRGWNWGKTDFAKSELVFSVRNQPAFEVPYSEISNTNLAGKNEVAVDLSLPADGEENGTNGHLGGARAKGRKTGAAEDQLVELRFYIPGTAIGKEKNEDGEEEEDAEDKEINAAQVFYDTLMARAEIGDVAGDTFATFLDILHLTPRGRFDIDMYEKSFRLRGKTYDYKIQYDSIKKYFLLPKPDDMHTLITIGLDPPLRQGQTRYPFLVMQFKREEEVTIDLNMTDDDLKNKYGGKLQAHYESPIATVISKLFIGLSGKKVLQPSRDFSSHHQQSGVKCSIKANEGHLFCLERAFLFVPKPATYIGFDNIVSITISRAGAGGASISASRTFDISVTLKSGGEHQFSNINREEQKPLEDFFQLKGIKTKNEMDEESALMAAAMKDEDLASSEDEVAAVARGSADEDDESVDEDFHASDESDVAEEYDSAHESSGGSDEEMVDADDDDDDDAAGSDREEVVERPKKKSKTK